MSDDEPVNVVHLRPILPTSNEADWAAAQTSALLKRVWDSDWIADADPGCFVLEAIHAEMCARGRSCDVPI